MSIINENVAVETYSFGYVSTRRLAVPKYRLLLVALTLGYVALLHWTYASVVAPVFSYMAYTYERPDVGPYFASISLIVALASRMPLAIRRPSEVVLWTLFILAVIPSLVVPLFVVGDNNAILVYGLVIAASFAALQYVPKIRLLPIRGLSISSHGFWVGVIVASALIYMYVGVTLGLRLRLVGLTNVYDLRDEYRGTIATSGTIIGYLVRWQGNVINPLIIGHAFTHRRYGLLVLCSLGQLVLFSVTGFKTLLLSMMLFGALLIVLSGKRRAWSGPALVGGAGVLIVGAILADRVASSIVYTSVFVRRLFMTPGLLSFFYFDFFSHNPKVLLSHSILRSLTDYPYDYSPPFLIGIAYFNRSDVSANANVFADAFSNFGLVGIPIFVFALGIFLWCYDSASRRLDVRIAAAMVALPAIALSNSALFSSMLTHGLLLALGLAWIYPRRGLSGGDERRS